MSNNEIRKAAKAMEAAAKKASIAAAELDALARSYGSNGAWPTWWMTGDIRKAADLLAGMAWTMNVRTLTDVPAQRKPKD